MDIYSFISAWLAKIRQRRNCRRGDHEWVSGGGRPCPYSVDINCSQSVYVCEHCGVYDYGEIGGPGWNDCMDARNVEVECPLEGTYDPTI